MRPVLCAVAIAALGALLAAAPAPAYDIAGDPWPGPRITYYPGLGSQSDEADRAARAWNRAKVGVSFKRGTREGAQVVIGYRGRGCGGFGSVGYVGPGSRGLVRVGRGCGDDITFLTVAHELGHVLGLGHERQICALMNASADLATGTPSRCERRPLSFWVSRPLRADDIAGARSLYRDS